MYSEQLKTFVMKQINSKIKYIMKKLNFCLFLMLFMSAMVMPATIQAKSIKHKFMRGIILEYDSLPGRATLTCGKTFVMTGHFDKICNTFVTDCKLIAKNFSRVINGTPQEGLTFEGEVAFVELNINGGIFYTITLVSGKLKLGNYELSNIKDTFFKLNRSDWSIYNLHDEWSYWEDVSSPFDEKYWPQWNSGNQRTMKYKQLKGGSPKQASCRKSRIGFDDYNCSIWMDRLRIDYDNGAYVIYYTSSDGVVSGIEYISLPNGDFYDSNGNKGKITFVDAIVAPADTTELDIPVNNELDGNYTIHAGPLVFILKTDSTKYLGSVTMNGINGTCSIVDIAFPNFSVPNTLSTQELGLKYYDGYLLDNNNNEDIYLHGENKSERATRIARWKVKEERAIAEEKAAKAERERQETAFRQKMIKKYGEYWFNMANSGRVAVGMPEELVQHMNGIYPHGSRGDVYIRPYNSRNVGDPWKYDWIYINNGKVSYITTKYSSD